MKCSDAIKKLDEELLVADLTNDQDYHDALSLAVGCLRFRLKLKDQWGFSFYELLDGEDRETPPSHEK